MKQDESSYQYAAMRKNILGSMIVVPFFFFIVVLGIGFYYFTRSIEDSTISRMVRTIEDHRQMIDAFLTERQTDLEYILNAYTIDELKDIDTLQSIFENLQKKSNAFVDLGVFNEEGVHLAYQGPFRLTGKVYRQEEWFVEVMKKGYYISDVFLGFRKVPHFIIAVTREDQGRKWVLRATIDTYLFNGLVETVRIGKTGEAYLINADGIFQTERRSGGNLMSKDMDYAGYQEVHNGIKTFIGKDFRGEKFLYATTWMKDDDWMLVVRQEKADAFKVLSNTIYLTLLIMLVGGTAIVALAFYVTNHIVRQMQRTDAEKGQLQQQLISATRLAELGEMAAGFAHEINNPLQIIKSEQSLMDMILSGFKKKDLFKNLDEEGASDLADLEDSMAQIRVQIERCAKITQAILKFGRQSEPVPQQVALQAFIPEIVDMVHKKASVHGLTIEQELSPDAPPIFGDPSQLQQVLLNLLNNGIDAVLERHGPKGGELVLAARPADNNKVEISVSDNGIGISSENQKKIFSPFFTTKPVGKGTGLGLSVCYGIIDSMGGTMKVHSEKGVGTTFTISLPAVEDKKEPKSE